MSSRIPAVGVVESQHEGDARWRRYSMRVEGRAGLDEVWVNVAQHADPKAAVERLSERTRAGLDACTWRMTPHAPDRAKERGNIQLIGLPRHPRPRSVTPPPSTAAPPPPPRQPNERTSRRLRSHTTRPPAYEARRRPLAGSASVGSVDPSFRRRRSNLEPRRAVEGASERQTERKTDRAMRCCCNSRATPTVSAVLGSLASFCRSIAPSLGRRWAGAAH